MERIKQRWSSKIVAIVGKNEEEESTIAASTVYAETDQTMDVLVTEATAVVTDDNDEEVPAQVGIKQPVEVATTVMKENDIDVTDKKEVLSTPPAGVKPAIAQLSSTEPDTESSNIIPEEPKPDTTTTTTTQPS